MGNTKEHVASKIDRMNLKAANLKGMFDMSIMDCNELQEAIMNHIAK